MNELALFAGAGGGILGGHLLGWRTVCAVEINAYAASVLCARQNDGILPPFPIWDDVCTFDGRPWRGIIDVVSGGFPCQDISVAGKGAGLDGERSGLWREMCRIIGEVRPRYAFIENSPALIARGLQRVLCDLAALGYDASWGIVSAADVGAPHLRERIWIVCHANDNGQPTAKIPESFVARSNCRPPWTSEAGKSARPDLQCAYVADANHAQREGIQFTIRSNQKHANAWSSSWWDTEPDVGRVADGVAARVDRLKAIGNGQVPAVAATAFRILSGLNNPAMPGKGSDERQSD